MQLGRILQQNSNLRPPIISDRPAWITFRRFMNDHCKLKDIFQSTSFKLVNSILIIVSCIMAIFNLFFSHPTYEIIDTVFINLFMVELILYLIAIGPENYFNKGFSAIDFILVTLGFFLQFPSI